jgi:uncharacterized protein
VSVLPSVIVASLLGSLHCVGMCGGLVSFYAGDAGVTRRTRWGAHAAYHLTRLAAYSLLGASAGAVGAGLDRAGAGLGLANLGALSAGAVILFHGLRKLWPRTGQSRLLQLGIGRPRSASLLARLERAFAALAQQARRRPPAVRAGVLGLSSALLPCGWLYAFVVMAASTGSWDQGALLLCAFWLGTVPALLGLGLGVERLSQPLRAHLPRLSVALLLSVSLFNVASRWPLLHGSEALASPGAAAPSCHAGR